MARSGALQPAADGPPQPLERPALDGAQHDRAVGRALRDELEAGHAHTMTADYEAQIKIAYESCVTTLSELDM